MAELNTSSDIDLDDESHETNEPPKKKKCYKQKYNSSWEKHPQLKGWLASVRRDCYRAFCKICDKELIVGLSELKNTKNQRNTKAKKQL